MYSTATQTATECKAGCDADKVQWWIQFRDTTLKRRELHVIIHTLLCSPVIINRASTPTGCLLISIRECALHFIWQSWPLLLGNVAGLEWSVARKEKSKILHSHSPYHWFYLFIHLSQVSSSPFCPPIFSVMVKEVDITLHSKSAKQQNDYSFQNPYL